MDVRHTNVDNSEQEMRYTKFICMSFTAGCVKNVLIRHITYVRVGCHEGTTDHFSLY
jgi:hypothetical protein